jgi:RecJ-like exonuclease
MIVCPECGGSGREMLLETDDVCSICKGAGEIDAITAARYFGDHPDARVADTIPQMTAVRPEEKS